jgi:hypothetical protein
MGFIEITKQIKIIKVLKIRMKQAKMYKNRCRMRNKKYETIRKTK